MNWQFNPFLLVPAFSAVLTAFLAWFGWRRRPAAGAVAFSLVMVSVTIWGFGNALELGAADLPTKAFWLKLEYIGILLLPASWLAFALQYTGHGEWLTRRTIPLLAFEPISMLALLWTNDLHRLVFLEMNVEPGEGILFQWANVKGPFFWGNIAYSYALILLGSFLLLQFLSRARGRMGGGELVVIVGVILPWVANVLSNLYTLPVIPGVDLTPFALSLTGLAFAWGLFHLRLLDFQPAFGDSPENLTDWRTRVLDGILRGIFVIWLFALASGIYNIIESYQENAHLYERPLLLAVSVAAVYLGVSSLLAVITFNRRLRYELRAGILLFILYALGVVGFLLASFSGDGRIFLFAFIVLAAILFDLRYNIGAFILSIITWLVIGWLEVNRVVIVPPETQVNSTDLSAWVSGSIVFLALSVAAYISIIYLLGALARSLDESRASLGREQRLGRVLRTVSIINQLIVRERNADRLLRQACEALLNGQGYAFAWIGLLEADGLTLKLVASAGDEIDPSLFSLRLDQEGSGPACAAATLRTRAAVYIHATPEGDPCASCPRLPQNSSRSALALPLQRNARAFGVLVVDHTEPGKILNSEEVALLQELADDLAYALETIQTEDQYRCMVEATSNLLAARDADTLWSVTMASVRSVLRAERAAIYLYDRVEDRLSCAHASGLSAEYINELNRLFHQAPGSRLITNPQPVKVDDVQTDPSVEAMRAWMIREGFRSYAVFPLVMSHGTFGAFVAYRDAFAPFSDADLNAGQTLSHTLGLALENMRLYTETHTRAAELGRLYASLQEMTASLLDPPALLEALARHVANALNATSSYIISIDQAEGTMTTLAEYWMEDAGDAERKPDMGAVFQMDEYPTIMRAMRAGECVVLQSDEPGLAEKERLQFTDYGIYSMLFIPISAHGNLLGDVEIWESRQRREFTQADIRLAQAMATQAASIIENAQLFAQTRQRQSELATMHDVAQAVSSSLELTDVLKQAATSMARILRVDYCILSDYDPQARTINTSARYSRDGEVDLASDKEETYLLGDFPVSEQVMSSGEPRVIRADDPQADPAELGFLQKYGYAVSLILPLRARGLPLGLAELCSFDPRRAFKPEEIHLARALADQVAVAIENARLYSRVEQSELYFRALIENAAEGVAILDAEGKFVYVAPSEHPLTGYRPDEALGTSTFQYIHPEDRPRLMQLFQECIQTLGAIVTTEYRQQRKDGVWRHYEVTGHNMLHDPHVRGVVVNYRDITERKQAEVKIQRHASELALAYDNTLTGWARALELRDELTEGHTRRVTELTLRLARAMDLPESDLVQIRRGAILHDIGKMGIPDSILLKQGALTDDEMFIMRQHPRFAYDMLHPIEFLRPALEIPYCHHEKWDGSGYPRGLKGAQIPLAARIFAVADVWDAVTSDRPYRPAWTKAKARKHIIAESGRYFDPRVVDVFLTLKLE